MSSTPQDAPPPADAGPFPYAASRLDQPPLPDALPDAGPDAAPGASPLAVAGFVLGVFSVVGLAFLGPVAIVVCRRILRDPAVTPGSPSRGLAVAGRVLGIIGTVFLVLAVVALVVAVVLLRSATA